MAEDALNKEELNNHHVSHLNERNLYSQKIYDHLLGRISEYETNEHELLGLCGPDKIQINAELCLNYGEIIALAGDYYGSPQELKNDKKENVLAILDLYGLEKESKFSSKMRDIFKNKKRFLNLTYWNFEHFQPQAEECYARWHQQAIEIAQEARTIAELLKIPKHSFVVQKVHEAFFVNGFADHFLTDAFASGHMRTPRLELHEESPSKGWYKAWAMHDEENLSGLWVKSNKYQTPWLAYGDKELTTEKATLHFQRSVEAVKASITDIESALIGRPIPHEWENLIPKPLNWEAGLKPNTQEWAQQKAEDHKNYEPLYRFKNNIIYKRI